MKILESKNKLNKKKLNKYEKIMTEEVVDEATSNKDIDEYIYNYLQNLGDKLLKGENDNDNKRRSDYHKNRGNSWKGGAGGLGMNVNDSNTDESGHIAKKDEVFATVMEILDDAADANMIIQDGIAANELDKDINNDSYETSYTNNSNQTSKMIMPADVTVEGDFETPGLMSIPGVGKTSLINTWVKRKGGISLINLNLAGADETTFSGMPGLNKEGHKVDFFASSFVSDLIAQEAKGTPYVIFFDEFNRTKPEVRVTAGELMLKHKLILNGAAGANAELTDAQISKLKNRSDFKVSSIVDSDGKNSIDNLNSKKAAALTKSLSKTVISEISSDMNDKIFDEDNWEDSISEDIEEIKNEYGVESINIQATGAVYLQNLLMVIVAMNPDDEPEILETGRGTASYEKSRITYHSMEASKNDCFNYLMGVYRHDLATQLKSDNINFRQKAFVMAIKKICLAQTILENDAFKFTTYSDYIDALKEASVSGEGLRPAAFGPRDLAKVLRSSGGSADKLRKILKEDTFSDRIIAGYNDNVKVILDMLNEYIEPEIDVDGEGKIDFDRFSRKADMAVDELSGNDQSVEKNIEQEVNGDLESEIQKAPEEDQLVVQQRKNNRDKINAVADKFTRDTSTTNTFANQNKRSKKLDIGKIGV